MAESTERAPSANQPSTSLLSRSARGASFLILLQVASRGFTFVVNQVLLRYLAPELLGISSQLDLYSVSILYFSRESVRVALQRHGSDGFLEQSAKGEAKGQDERQRQKLQAIVNFSYVPLLIGTNLSLFFGCLYIFFTADVVVRQSPFFLSSFVIYTFSTFLELFVEPYHALAQQRMQYGVRASAEGLGAFVKCITTCALAIWSSKSGRELGALPFAIGQLGLVLVLMVVYLRRLAPTIKQTGITTLNPTKTFRRGYPFLRAPESWLPPLWSLYRQAILKQLLTNGDSYLMATFTSLSTQGSYALAANYGGLVARIILQPIEESSRSLFGRLLSSPAEVQHPPQNPQYSPLSSSSTSASTPATPPAAALTQSLTYLTTLLRALLILTLPLLTFGPPFSPPLLTILAGPRWSTTSAPQVLSAYCYYLPLLAINGILEAFVAAVASSKDLARQNAVMVGSSIAFLTAGYMSLVLLEQGAPGLVVANAVAMIPRIIWGGRFVKAWFEEQGVAVRIRHFLPNAGTIAIGTIGCGLMFVAPTPISASALRGNKGNVMGYDELKALGKRAVTVAVGFVITVPMFEREFLGSIVRMVRGKRR